MQLICIPCKNILPLFVSIVCTYCQGLNVRLVPFHLLSCYMLDVTSSRVMLVVTSSRRPKILQDTFSSSRSVTASLWNHASSDLSVSCSWLLRPFCLEICSAWSKLSWFLAKFSYCFRRYSLIESLTSGSLVFLPSWTSPALKTGLIRFWSFLALITSTFFPF